MTLCYSSRSQLIHSHGEVLLRTGSANGHHDTSRVDSFFWSRWPWEEAAHGSSLGKTQQIPPLIHKEENTVPSEAGQVFTIHSEELECEGHHYMAGERPATHAAPALPSCCNC